MVEDRLRRLAEIRREYAKSEGREGEAPSVGARDEEERGVGKGRGG
jgi:hypothetical protein